MLALLLRGHYMAVACLLVLPCGLCHAATPSAEVEVRAKGQKEPTSPSASKEEVAPEEEATTPSHYVGWDARSNGDPLL